MHLHMCIYLQLKDKAMPLTKVPPLPCLSQSMYGLKVPATPAAAPQQPRHPPTPPWPSCQSRPRPHKLPLVKPAVAVLSRVHSSHTNSCRSSSGAGPSRCLAAAVVVARALLSAHQAWTQMQHQSASSRGSSSWKPGTSGSICSLRSLTWGLAVVTAALGCAPTPRLSACPPL